MSAKEYVASMLEGELVIHGPPANGNYDTLCGCDIDDPGIEHYPAELPKGRKINCSACLDIFTTAKKLRITDFEAKP